MIARIAPSYLNVFLNLGNLYKNLSRLEEAKEMFYQAIAYRLDFIPAYLNLGDIELMQNQPAEALQIFKRGLEQDPLNADLLYNCGIAILQSSTNASLTEDIRQQALDYFEAALR